MSLPRIAVIRNVESQKIRLPRYGNPVGTSMTLLSANQDSVKIAPGHYEVIDTGLAIALPIGLEAQVRSLKESTDTGIFVLNAPLTIDASDRKDIKVCLYNASSESVIIKYNDPIALLIFSPALRIEWDDMTPKRQIQAIQTDAFIKRTHSENHSDDTQQTPEEFEPVESSEINDIKNETTETSEDVVAESEVQSVEPPAIVKEFEEMESHFYDSQEEGEKNEN